MVLDTFYGFRMIVIKMKLYHVSLLFPSLQPLSGTLHSTPTISYSLKLTTFSSFIINLHIHQHF